MRQVEYTDEGKLVQLKRGRDPSCTELSLITTGQKIEKGQGRGCLWCNVCSKKVLEEIFIHKEDQNFCKFQED